MPVHPSPTVTVGREKQRDGERKSERQRVQPRDPLPLRACGTAAEASRGLGIGNRAGNKSTPVIDVTGTLTVTIQDRWSERSLTIAGPKVAVVLCLQVSCHVNCRVRLLCTFRSSSSIFRVIYDLVLCTSHYRTVRHLKLCIDFTIACSARPYCSQRSKFP